jgi:hypothetical protein
MALAFRCADGIGGTAGHVDCVPEGREARDLPVQQAKKVELNHYMRTGKARFLAAR